VGISGTVSRKNFIGTTDGQALDFRKNNVLRARITSKMQIETLIPGNPFSLEKAPVQRMIYCLILMFL
jgi:hypothetical protein